MKNDIGANTPKLIFCKDCGSRESWQRYPERDVKIEPSQLDSTRLIFSPIKDAGGTLEIPPAIFEYCYRCRICGALTWYPYEPELKIKRG